MYACVCVCVCVCVCRCVYVSKCVCVCICVVKGVLHDEVLEQRMSCMKLARSWDVGCGSRSAPHTRHHTTHVLRAHLAVFGHIWVGLRGQDLQGCGQVPATCREEVLVAELSLPAHEY